MGRLTELIAYMNDKSINNNDYRFVYKTFTSTDETTRYRYLKNVTDVTDIDKKGKDKSVKNSR